LEKAFLSCWMLLVIGRLWSNSETVATNLQALIDITIEYDGLCKLWTVLHGSNFGKYLKISQKVDGFVTS
jgi:hypothetical protein